MLNRLAIRIFAPLTTDVQQLPAMRQHVIDRAVDLVAAEFRIPSRCPSWTDRKPAADTTQRAVFCYTQIRIKSDHPSVIQQPIRKRCYALCADAAHGGKAIMPSDVRPEPTTSRPIDLEDWKDQRAMEAFPLLADRTFLELCRSYREADRLGAAQQLELPFAELNARLPGLLTLVERKSTPRTR